MTNTQYKLEPPNQYSGKQMIFNSNRVILNAKEDSIILSAKQAIGLSASSLHFNTEGKCIVNSSKIQLGLNATEPLLLGNKTTELLKILLKQLEETSEALSKAKAYLGTEKYDLTEINITSIKLNRTVKELLTNIENIKSKQNYTL